VSFPPALHLLRDQSSIVAFDVGVAEVSNGVAAVARDTGVPVIFGVLTTDTLQQALEMGSLMAALPR
jgi:6,7-dimethyl-8-ribityllumazine synthase